MTAAPWRIWTALGLVYVFWGSTYLGIAYAVDGNPPLLVAGVRSTVAAVLLAAYLRVRRGRHAFRGTVRQWARTAWIGVLLLSAGNGGVTVAEHADLPSGLAALLVASVPLYVVLLRMVAGDRPHPRTVTGVGIGFVGLGLLLLPGSRPGGVSALPAGLVLVAALLWAVGSFQASRWSLPPDPLARTVGQLAGGGLVLLGVGFASGERVPSTFHASAFWALVYLIVLGSVVAFTAYSWLLGAAPVSQVATYAYVNPVVAVLLGVAFAGERIGRSGLVGGLLTVVAVFVVVSQEGRARAAVPAAEVPVRP